MDKNSRVEDNRGAWEKVLSSKLQAYHASKHDMPPLALPTKRAHVSRWAWVVISASVAAVVLLALFILPGTPGGSSDQTSESSSNNMLAKNNAPEASTPAVSVDQPPAEATRVDQTSSEIEGGVTEESTQTDSLPQTDSDPMPEGKPHTAIGSKRRVDNSSSKRPREPEESNPIITSQERRPLKLSLFTSGVTLSSDGMMLSQMGDGIMSGQGPDYAVQETPLLELGTTVLLPLTQKLSIQGGLKYTWYRIKVSNHIDSYSLDVHSLGVPLDLLYTLYSTGDWRMYGQYGVGVNIPVKSTLTGVQPAKGNASISLDTSLALGVEYRITSQFSLYSSLGVTYDLLQMKSNLPDTEISRWHGRMEAGVPFRVGR